MKKPRNVIGSKLQQIRAAAKLSQSELAAIGQRSGWDITRYVIAKIESRSRCVTDYEIMLLADALKVEAKDFFPQAKVWAANRAHFRSDSE